MKIDDFLELVKTRRSIRRFKPDPIPDEYIEKIIEAGRWAMSGANAQPWEFVVVRDQNLKNKISELYVGSRTDLQEIEKTRVEHLQHPQLINLPTGPPGFRDAPALIVVCGDRRTFQATVLAAQFTVDGGGPGDTYTKNIANATHNICLACAALGLGSQWITVSSFWAQPLKILLGIPHILEVHQIIPVGYPAYEPEPGYRRELSEIVHYDKYDPNKFRTTRAVIDFIADLRARTKPGYNKAKSI